MRKAILGILIIAALFCMPNCTDSKSHAHAIFMLIDVSGTYAKEVGKAESVVSYLLGELQAGDSLMLSGINSRSFSEKLIITGATFDSRPSKRNAQKKMISAAMQEFVSKKESSAHTDITGAMIQATSYLNETGCKNMTILIFSDMQEDLDKKTIRDFPIDMQGIRVVALNVTKLRSDNIDPRLYLDRLKWWKERVITAGADEWVVMNDLTRLEGYLAMCR
ncbi:MAG: VWA domain-containing protein [Deltaproteobacteria bacterium]|nr:VWA domain-containing protein [Deltaproteobacteria bacterium]